MELITSKRVVKSEMKAVIRMKGVLRVCKVKHIDTDGNATIYIPLSGGVSLVEHIRL